MPARRIQIDPPCLMTSQPFSREKHFAGQAGILRFATPAPLLSLLIVRQINAGAHTKQPEDETGGELLAQDNEP